MSQPSILPPSCLTGGYVDEAVDDLELYHLVLVQMDLIDEMQDGTEEYTTKDIREIRNWLKKYKA
jgi:hypothetical protein